VKHFQNDGRIDYHLALLKLALDSTVEEDGPYFLKEKYVNVSQKRGLAFLEKGKQIDIAILAANYEREEKFLSVKIPILKGLLGYRIAIIRKNDQALFGNIETLEQLRRKFVAGFGSHWADMEILQFNQLPVVGVAVYKNLFKMLSKKRFQYFPRGINEIWNEVEERRESHPDLSVEKSIALYYPYVVYFYVNKNNWNLANRIERGLNKTLQSGEFKKLFLKFHQKSIEKSNLKNRKMFRLKNPTLPDNIAFPDTSWWLTQ